MKTKIKIIKIYDDYDSYRDYANSIFYPVTEDWEEVTQQKISEIRDAIQYANSDYKNVDGRYVLIEYGDSLTAEVFKKASDFKIKMQKQKEKEARIQAEAKAKRDEKALSRKIRQLEKLKKELGAD